MTAKRRWEPSDGLRTMEVRGDGAERVVYCTHCMETVIPSEAELKPTRIRDCVLRHGNRMCPAHGRIKYYRGMPELDRRAALRGVALYLQEAIQYQMGCHAPLQVVLRVVPPKLHRSGRLSKAGCSEALAEVCVPWLLRITRRGQRRGTVLRCLNHSLTLWWGES